MPTLHRPSGDLDKGAAFWDEPYASCHLCPVIDVEAPENVFLENSYSGPKAGPAWERCQLEGLLDIQLSDV